MPITIQEIIASDTISQLVDKTNFNFDQLLLNGGGPAGPLGPAGPTGPPGGRGPKGSTWYEDTSTSAPGNTPVAVPPTTTPLEGDYYLQFDGAVWEYTGLTWSQTSINLTGPIGPSGQDGGFGAYFGQTILNNQQSLTTTPTGFGAGANQINQGIPLVLIGGVASNAPQVSGITRTGEYQIDDALATTLASDIVSLLVHQKDTSATAIKFMGGTDLTNSQNFEQLNYLNFATIALRADDALAITIPKPATTPANNTAVNGFSITSPGRGADIDVGGQINLTSGSNPNPYNFAGENGNFTIRVNSQSGGSGNGNKFQRFTSGTGGSTNLFAGANISNPGTSYGTRSGNILQESKGWYTRGTGTFQSRFQDGIFLQTESKIELYGGVSSAAILNADIVQIGGDEGGIPTKGITMSTLGSNTSGIAISTDGTSPSPSDGITLQTFGTTGTKGNIDIIATNPNAGVPGSNGITINSGGSLGSGNIDIKANGGTIDINSVATATVPNVETVLSITDNELIKLRSSDGLIIIGGATDATISNSVRYKPTLVVAPNTTNTWNPGAAPQLPRVHFGTIPADEGGGSSLQPFFGGFELIGPPGAPGTAMGANVTLDEKEGALHVRTGLNNSGRNPGAVYIYNTSRTGAAPPSGSGEYSTNSVRLWSTGTSKPNLGTSLSGPRGIKGLTLGLNQLTDSASLASTNGPSVTGRINLYGTRNTSTTPMGDGTAAGTSSGANSLDQNTVYGGQLNPYLDGANNYGGVNVGDYFRGRQSFKVWGDYTGDIHQGESSHTYGEASAQAFAGPTSENQILQSGRTTRSDWIRNLGNAQNSQNDVMFRYRLNWQRVGMVVTGSGILYVRVNANGANNPGSPNYNWDKAMIQYDDGTNSCASELQFGPIPLPLIQNTAGSSLDVDTFNSANNTGGSVFGGIANGMLRYDNQNTLTTTLRFLDGTQANYDAQGPIGGGTVRGGDATGITFPDMFTSTEYMWLDIKPNHQNSYAGRYGIGPAIYNFTFTYTLAQVT